jgi:hypothetical protein
LREGRVELRRILAAGLREVGSPAASAADHRRNHHDETRAALADIYRSFTEGLDTADLKDAKVLLDELSR